MKTKFTRTEIKPVYQGMEKCFRVTLYALSAPDLYTQQAEEQIWCEGYVRTHKEAILYQKTLKEVFRVEC